MGTIPITLTDQDDAYHGFDPELGKDINLGNGQIAETTTEHLARLDADWPKRFRKLTKQQADKHADELAAQRAIDAASQTAAGLTPTPDPATPPDPGTGNPDPPNDPGTGEPAAPNDTGTSGDPDADATGLTDATAASDGQ